MLITTRTTTYFDTKNFCAVKIFLFHEMWKKQRKTLLFLIRWCLRNFDSGNFLHTVVCFCLVREWRISEKSRNSTAKISRSTYRLLGCFQKSFHILKVKNPDTHLRKFFQFLYFVSRVPNYNLPNVCTIRVIFDQERVEETDV